jgi:hypothetical protein
MSSRSVADRTFPVVIVPAAAAGRAAGWLVDRVVA